MTKPKAQLSREASISRGKLEGSLRRKFGWWLQWLSAEEIISLDESWDHAREAMDEEIRYHVDDARYIRETNGSEEGESHP